MTCPSPTKIPLLACGVFHVKLYPLRKNAYFIERKIASIALNGNYLQFKSFYLDFSRPTQKTAILRENSITNDSEDVWDSNEHSHTHVQKCAIGGNPHSSTKKCATFTHLGCAQTPGGTTWWVDSFVCNKAKVGKPNHSHVPSHALRRNRA